MKDDFLYKGLREKLISQLRTKGISDERVLGAMNRVPRHEMMDSGFVKFAYKDQAFPIGAGQTISQPYTVAFQTELLQVEKGHKVLEVGTGSGYQAAVLMEMGAKVFTIERNRELYLKAQTLLPSIGYKPHFFYGDGYEGQPSYGPYDRIIVTAGANSVPEKLPAQLKPGGRMVIPVGGKNGQEMTLVEKNIENDIKITRHGAFIFVPLLPGKS
jgi:protein-L-isoaspartate(D-aspartate) O-methyltransferase